MKKLFCICFMLLISSFVFASTQDDFEKVVDTFYTKGSFVKFTKSVRNQKRIFVVNKNSIHSIYIYEDRVYFIFDSEDVIDNHTDEQEIKYSDIDFSSDENGNIIITKK